MKRLMMFMLTMAVMAFIYGLGIPQAAASPMGQTGSELYIAPSLAFASCDIGLPITQPSEMLVLGDNCSTPATSEGICAMNSYAKNAGCDFVQRAWMINGVVIDNTSARVVATVNTGTRMEVRLCAWMISTIVGQQVSASAFADISAVGGSNQRVWPISAVANYNQRAPSEVSALSGSSSQIITIATSTANANYAVRTTTGMPEVVLAFKADTASLTERTDTA